MRLNEISEQKPYCLVFDDDNSGGAWLIEIGSLSTIVELLNDDVDDIFEHDSITNTLMAILERLGFEEEDYIRGIGGKRWAVGVYELTSKQAQAFIDIGNMTLLSPETLKDMEPPYDEDEDEWG